MSNVDYKVLKSNIIRCCDNLEPHSIDFKVDFEKLSDFEDNIGLVPVNIGLTSRHLKPSDVPFISEYFIGQRLSWFEKDRRIAILTFFVKENLDEEGRAIIDKINTPEIDDPTIDKIHLMADMVARYPAYFATVVSYRNLDPKRIGKPSYAIICRANKVAIKDQNYEYDPRDMA